MRRGLLLLALALPAAAAAQPDPHRPTGEERRWLANCLEGAPAGNASTAYGRCAGRLAAACLGRDASERPARVRQPPGRNDHPRSCAPIEAALWDEWLNRWYGEAMRAAPPPAQAALRRAQQAWIAFRDAGCDAESVLAEGPLGGDNAATCRLEQTAQRALELRRIADDLAPGR